MAIWRLVERLLLLIGVVCLGYYAYVSAESALYQAYEARELDAIRASAPDSGEPPPPAVVTDAPRVEPPRPESGTLIGRLEIPRLRVSAIVRAGVDARTLRLAVGHIGGTA